MGQREICGGTICAGLEIILRSLFGLGPSGSLRQCVGRRVAFAGGLEIGGAILARDVGQIVIGKPSAGSLEEIAFGDGTDVPQPRGFVP
jgi:hypothetical protein